MHKDQIAEAFQQLQDKITSALEQTDGKAKFTEDLWTRNEGGGGRSRVLENGKIIEKGGVQFSSVHGKLPEKIKYKLKLESDQFFATGISLIMHPESPHIPIIHMNVRYFEMDNGNYWFGGGIDLTPIYVDPKQASNFHHQLKNLCDQYHSNYYPKFKTWADDYFYLPFREESRGIGGIFFDHLKENEEISKKQLFDFVMNVGNLFIPIYTDIMKENATQPWTEKEKEWQLHRRGRYVEFNLVLDKGTKFGLDTNGRTESILVSMPPEVKWTYNHKIEKGSKEEQTLHFLKKGIDWLK